MESDSKDWRSKRRNRGANQEWKEVFFLLYRQFQFKSFDAQHVMEAAEKIPIKITKESLRVKLSRYVKSGLLQKPQRSKYKLTETGADFFGVKEMTNNALFAEERF